MLIIIIFSFSGFSTIVLFGGFPSMGKALASSVSNALLDNFKNKSTSNFIVEHAKDMALSFFIRGHVIFDFFQ